MAERYTPQVGDFVQPDAWKIGETLEADSGFKDSSFPGCQFRLPGGFDYKLAVNIVVTGKPHWNTLWSGGKKYRSRCKVEFVHDDNEPSTFTGAWIYHND